jgi:hypothetical protein
VVDALDQGVAPLGEARQVGLHLGDHGDPTETIGQLGGVVAPEGVVA